MEGVEALRGRRGATRYYGGEVESGVWSDLLGIDMHRYKISRSRAHTDLGERLSVPDTTDSRWTTTRRDTLYNFMTELRR